MQAHRIQNRRANKVAQNSCARAGRPQLDHAGPDRNLGRLYRDAPGWPRQHLVRSVELAPYYPENRLNLLEAFQKWGELDAARRELASLDSLSDRAKETFAGQDWAEYWADWEKRRDQVKRKIEIHNPKDGPLRRGRMPQ